MIIRSEHLESFRSCIFFKEQLMEHGNHLVPVFFFLNEKNPIHEHPENHLVSVFKK